MYAVIAQRTKRLAQVFYLTHAVRLAEGFLFKPTIVDLSNSSKTPCLSNNSHTVGSMFISKHTKTGTDVSHGATGWGGNNVTANRLALLFLLALFPFLRTNF